MKAIGVLRSAVTGAHATGYAATLFLVTVATSWSQWMELKIPGQAHQVEAEVDVNNDGFVDFKTFRYGIGTDDEPQSAYSTFFKIEPIASNLVLTRKSSRAEPFERIANLPATTTEVYYSNLPTAISAVHYNLIDKRKLVYETTPWDNGWFERTQGFIFGLFESHDGYHPAWIEILVDDSYGPRMTSVTWKKETVSRSLFAPKIENIRKLATSQVLVDVSGLIYRQNYSLDASNDLRIWKSAIRTKRIGGNWEALVDIPRETLQIWFRISYQLPSRFH